MTKKILPIDNICQTLDAIDGRAGIGKNLFESISRLTPAVSVELIIKSQDEQSTLLTWRDDEFYGPGWHVPGGVVRFKETLSSRVEKVLKQEIAAPALKFEGPIGFHEIFNDQMIITKGISKVNDILYKNCTSWQDTMNGTDTYYMTTWLWIYQRSENFCIYQLWYSDPEYYNDDNTFKVLYIYDIKNNYVIYNTTSKLLPIYKMLTGLKSSMVDTKGTSVQDKEFYYKTHIETQNFEAITESIPNTSIKVCDNKYMYERTDKTIDYGKMEPLAKVMEEVRYDEFSNQSMLKIKYNGKDYHEKAKVVVDAMTWKNGWPTGYPKFNRSFFNKIFKLG